MQVLPLNHPIRIAEEAATVDQISQGRFNFGIGRSGLTISYSGYNIPYSESRGRFWESLEVILKAWTTDEFSYEGEFYNFHNVRLMPKPVQQPHPPIRMACASLESFARAGSMGIPIFVNVGFGTFSDLKSEDLTTSRRPGGRRASPASRTWASACPCTPHPIRRWPALSPGTACWPSTSASPT